VRKILDLHPFIIIVASCLFNQSVAFAFDQNDIIRRLEAIETKNSLLEKENTELKKRLLKVERSGSASKHVADQNAYEGHVKTRATGSSRVLANQSSSAGNEMASFSPLDEEKSGLGTSSGNIGENTLVYNNRRFELSASFLGLMPSTSNLVYGTEVSPYPAPTPNWNDRTVTPSFSPSFRLGARYFAGQSNDIELEWTHLVAEANNSVGVNPSQQMIGPSWLIGSQASNYATAYGKGRYNYDVINLEGGHTFCANCDFQFRPFAGIKIVDLSTSMANVFTNAYGAQFNTNGLNQINSETSSRFTGAGPRIGLGTQYNWNNFEFSGKMGAALLIGTQQSKYTQSTTCSDGCVLTYNGSTIVGNNQGYTTPNTTQVIPSIDAKLAAAYAFAPTKEGQFKLEVGWQAAAYFNTVSQYIMTNLCPCDIPYTTSGLYLATGQHTLNNFTVQGPYISGRWAY